MTRYLSTALVTLSLAILPAFAQAQSSAPAAEKAQSANAVSDSRISQQVENAVVKVFATVRHPDLSRPWTKQAPTEIFGSGVVIEGHRVLTNAHMVLYAGQIQVQANQEGDKYSATVVAVSPGMDLAVLSLDDASFFDRHAPLKRSAALPDIKDNVLAYGFPVGGSSLSITKGIVSRIEFAAYNALGTGLRIQIDAAINPGNSGGAATVGDKMIGLAFSHLNNAQNIGYIIPNEEIDLFLAEIAKGKYVGKPTMHDEWQTLENPALRAFLKLDKSVHGIVVHQPLRPDADYPLKEWDVITKVGETPIDDQGMILTRQNLRIGFLYAVQKAAKDGKARLTLVRAGKTMQVDVPLLVEKPQLIADLKGTYPSYFIYGPVVFSRASTAYVGSLAGNPNAAIGMSILKSPLITQRADSPTPEREELVVIPSPLFPQSVSNGYSNPSGSVIYSINGVPVRSLGHLVQILRDLSDEYVTIELDNHGGEAMVFRRTEMISATDDILSDNGVRAQGSPDMMEVWTAKKTAPATP